MCNKEFLPDETLKVNLIVIDPATYLIYYSSPLPRLRSRDPRSNPNFWKKGGGHFPGIL